MISFLRGSESNFDNININHQKKEYCFCKKNKNKKFSAMMVIIYVDKWASYGFTSADKKCLNEIASQFIVCNILVL